MKERESEHIMTLHLSEKATKTAADATLSPSLEPLV